jgi:hypothetical protein
LSTTACPIKVTNLTHHGTYVSRDSENTVICENTGKVTAVVAIMTVSSRNVQNSKYKTKTANKMAILTETRSKSKQKIARSRKNRTGKYNSGVSYKLVVKSKTIRVLLDSGSSGDLLFLKNELQSTYPLLRGLSHSRGVLLTAPLSRTRWATSRLLLWSIPAVKRR